MNQSSALDSSQSRRQAFYSPLPSPCISFTYFVSLSIYLSINQSARHSKMLSLTNTLPASLLGSGLEEEEAHTGHDAIGEDKTRQVVRIAIPCAVLY